MIYVYQIFTSQQQSILKYSLKWLKKNTFFFYRWPDDYKVGLTKQILLNINVINTGENSYDTQCSIQLPVGVEYVSSNSSSTVRKQNPIKFSNF
jgi:hypothetical protein